MSIVLTALLAGCAANESAFSSAPPSLHVGGVALDAGQPEIAVAIADAHLAKSPDDPEALLLRGNALAVQGRTAEATATYKRALKDKSVSAAAALGLSRILTGTDPAAAATLLAEVTMRGDATADVWNNLGVANDLQDRHVEAQSAYRQALAVDPAMATAKSNLAHSLTLAPTLVASRPPVEDTAAIRPIQPMVSAAVSSCMVGLSNEPQPATVTTVQTNFIVQALYPYREALHVAEAKLRCDPSNLDLRRRVVDVALGAGDGVRAREVAAMTILQAPNNPSGYVMEAAVERFQGRDRQGLQSLLKARDLLQAAAANPEPRLGVMHTSVD